MSGATYIAAITGASGLLAIGPFRTPGDAEPWVPVFKEWATAGLKPGHPFTFGPCRRHDATGPGLYNELFGAVLDADGYITGEPAEAAA
jgi:hypothetical protein